MRKEIDPGKLRTMIRSILPSRARGTTFAKTIENRYVRRKVRLALRTGDEKADPRRNSYHSDTVRWRRGADKLNHFMRWCEELTKGMTKQEALDYVRTLLPRNLIGDQSLCASARAASGAARRKRAGAYGVSRLGHQLSREMRSRREPPKATARLRRADPDAARGDAL